MKTTNANRRVKFKITARDIARGKPKDTHRCAAALALKRVLGADDVDVRVTRTFVEKDGHVTRYETPEKLRFEAKTFDRGGKFEPGDYELKPVAPSQMPQAQSKTNKKNLKKRRAQPRRQIAKRRPTPNVRASARGTR